MAKKIDKTALTDLVRDDIVRCRDQMDDSLFEMETARNRRDDLFVQAYDARMFSVTEMARLSGMRRESVHVAISRTKERTR